LKPHQQDEVEHRYDSGPADTFGGGACEWLQRHVVRHFVAGAPLENTAREYLANLRVQEAVYRSSSEAKRIELAGFRP
jgi:D-apiose dehydrogenase